MKRLLVIGMVLALLFTGCATPQKTGVALETIAVTVPTIAHQLDDVYAVLIKAKAVPDKQTLATKWLAILDMAAPVIKEQGAALSGDTFNWTSAAVSGAILVAKILGVWL